MKFHAKVWMRISGRIRFEADNRDDAEEHILTTCVDELDVVDEEEVLTSRILSPDKPAPPKLVPMEGELRAFDRPREEDQVLITVNWSCGMAIGGPRWIGTEAYECPECPGEGAFVVAEEEVELEGDEYRGPHTTCTLCHQDLEDWSHYSIDEGARKKRLKAAAGV